MQNVSYSALYTDMSNKRYCCILALFLLQTNDVNSELPSLKMDSLNSLLNNNIKSLTIVRPSDESASRLDDQSDVVDAVDLNIDENRAYDLYHMLRTTQENERLDDVAFDEFEKTKVILRQALRRRCNRLDNCVKKCPKKITIQCTYSCQKIHDDKALCEEPEKPKCKRPKCGRTLPPYWL